LAGVACGWALIYYWQRRHTWEWAGNGSLLILVGLVAAPYCWPYDQTIAMPALLHGAYTTRSRAMLAVLALAGVPVMGAIMAGIKITAPLYLFVAPAWLAWYLVVLSMRSKHAEISTPEHSIGFAGGTR
jgi:hypothetical protein